MLNTLQVSLREGMKRTILSLEQQGKIVFAPCDPRACRSIFGCHHHGPLPRVEILVGLGNGGANILYRLAIRVARQIRAKKSFLAIHCVTLRAPRFSREKSFALLRIARQGKGSAVALQLPQMLDHSFDSGLAKATEGRHSSARNASPNDLHERSIRRLLNLASAGNVWPALTASPIQPVTSCAFRGKNLWALLHAPLLRSHERTQATFQQHHHQQ
jgi:hypothetical protein